MPKVDRATAVRVERQAYPGRLRARTDGCWRTRLSDAVELTQLGVGEVELAPGSATGLMHWHENEDEFVYVVEGEVTLVEEGGGEQILRAGDGAGFKAGVAVGHTFENRSDQPVRLLEIGPRTATRDTAHYVGLDLVLKREGRDMHFETRDGRRVGRDDEIARIDPA